MEKFLKKWDGKYLADAGAYVSKEFDTFQNAMKRNLKRMAEEIGATLCWYNKSHYDQSAMFERNGKYAYFHYSNMYPRSEVNLKNNVACYCRTAGHEKDYRGGSNNHCAYVDVQKIIDRLLNQEHRQV